MTADKKRFRHELKYLLNMQDAALLERRLSSFMSRDPHADEDGEYTVCSLYFDDYFKSAHVEKESGIYARKKYRIRVYNHSDSFILFERKIKNDQYIFKQSAELTRAELDLILGGSYDFLEKHEHPLLREIYFEMTSRVLRPRVTVSYERTPYLMETGDVRVTFDRHVRGSSYFELFDEDIPALEVVPANKLIVEVKFTGFLPSIVRKALPPRAAEYSAVSKFLLCCGVCPIDGTQLRTKAVNAVYKSV